MRDIEDIIRNIDYVHESTTSFQVLKDFERVLDELGLYVFENWEDGELAMGPDIERYWVTCGFMWPREEMPDPAGGKRLLDYDCKVTYEKTHIIVPRKIKEPSDMRPATNKGKLDRKPVWFVEIMMPKKLIMDIYSGYNDTIEKETEPSNIPQTQGEPQDADDIVAGEGEGGAEGDEGGEDVEVNI